MIQLSDTYKSSIINMFGDIGKNWLNNVSNIIDKYINKFELKNVELVGDLKYNILMFADSKDYGKVVLKVEIPFKELTIRESKALELNNGIGACKCYYSNIDDGIVLMERLLPGYPLSTINSLEERVKIFAGVLNRFDIEIGNYPGLPTYREILNRSIDIANKDDRFKDSLEYVIIADDLYKDIEKDNDSKYLIHSDFHKDNILMSEKEWKAIDPHGFIGDKSLDVAIFIQNELDGIGYTNENFDLILNYTSKYCHIDKEKTTKALIVNYILNICWDIEVNLGEEHLKNCKSNIEKIISYYNSKLSEINKLTLKNQN